MSEFDTEPVPGLPEYLPSGEAMLWQGKPDWWALARSALHVRKVALYFIVVGVFLCLDALWAGEPLGIALSQGVSQLLIGTGAVALLCVLAWLMSRTTVYTLTSRRLVMRFGVALPITVNLPFTMLESADLRRNPDGSGDIALTMARGEKISFMLFWPHVRPWHFSRPQPALRSIPDAAAVGALLSEALVAHQAPSGSPATGRAKPLGHEQDDAREPSDVPGTRREEALT